MVERMAFSRGRSRRATQLPPDWVTRRARILHRDGHRCTFLVAGVRCGAQATDVHHLDTGGSRDHSDGNLTSLCGPHHAHLTARQGQAARVRLTRTPEPHPGLITPPGTGTH